MRTRANLRWVLPLLVATGCTGEIGIFADSIPEGSSIGDNPSNPSNPSTPAEFQHADPTMRRLTSTEYRNTVQDVLGAGYMVPESLPPDAATNGWTSIAMSSITVSPSGVDQYEAAGFELAEHVIGTPTLRNAIVPCADGNPLDLACMRQMVENIGPKLWRRPMTEMEVNAYAQPGAIAAQTLGSFDEGAKFALAGLLQSPNFLYRIEYGEPDPERPGLRKLTGYEVASKLSYLIWGTVPSEYTLQLARDGKLSTPEQIRDEAERMLAAQQAREHMGDFWDEYLELTHLETQVKDSFVYPDFTPGLASEMRQETLKFMEYLVFDERADMREMFTSRTTFVNPRLAEIYRLPAELTPARDFEQIEMPVDAHRQGILGHASILTVQSHAVATSPTYRGKFIKTALLCDPPPPPPPSVVAVLPEPDPNAGEQTLRQRLEGYFSEPSCGACHQLTDVIGFSLESFNAIGGYRELDNGLPIDTTGNYNGTAFDDMKGFTDILAQDPEAMSCMARRTYRHVMGHVEDEKDEPLVQEIEAKFVASGYRFKELMLDIVGSEAFLWVREEGAQ
ncbi:MAG: DUF1592 domain-containing protein [bacterium]